jgi:Spx/MgsR family transcriptional regulator
MKIYGIKSCDSVKKALKFFKKNSIEFEFIDFKVDPVDMVKINSWLNKVDIDTILNSKSKTYRDLKLKELDLDVDGKKKYLLLHQLLIKRPIVELDSGEVIVGFKENRYQDIFFSN